MEQRRKKSAVKQKMTACTAPGDTKMQVGGRCTHGSTHTQVHMHTHTHTHKPSQASTQQKMQGEGDVAEMGGQTTEVCGTFNKTQTED